MHRREFIVTGLAVLGAPAMPPRFRRRRRSRSAGGTRPPRRRTRRTCRTCWSRSFNEAHPDQELSIDFRGQELDKQLRVAMLSGSGPDIVYTAGPSYVASMAQAGQLLALDDYAQKLGWNDRVLPVFVELGKYNGKLYALPEDL